MAWHDVVARMQMDDMVYHVHGNGIWWKQIQPWHTKSNNRSVAACYPTQLCDRCTVASIYAPECKCHNPKLRELIIQVAVIVCVHILCSLSQLNTGAHFHNFEILENLPLFCAPARDIFHIDLSWASWRSANRRSGFSFLSPQLCCQLCCQLALLGLEIISFWHGQEESEAIHMSLSVRWQPLWIFPDDLCASMDDKRPALLNPVELRLGFRIALLETMELDGEGRTMCSCQAAMREAPK